MKIQNIECTGSSRLESFSKRFPGSFRKVPTSSHEVAAVLLASHGHTGAVVVDALSIVGARLSIVKQTRPRSIARIDPGASGRGDGIFLSGRHVYACSNHASDVARLARRQARTVAANAIDAECTHAIIAIHAGLAVVFFANTHAVT